MTSNEPSTQLRTEAVRFAAMQYESSNMLPSTPSWDDLRRLVRNPYLFSTEQVSAFITLLESSPSLCSSVSSISLEDRSLTVDAYSSKWPYPTLEEVKTWRSLCKYISLLSRKHNLRNVSLAVTASKRIQEETDKVEGEDSTEPAKAWTEPILLDRLAVTGCDAQQPTLVQCFRPQETIIYTAGPAWNSVGFPTLLCCTTSPMLEIVVGSFPTEGFKATLIETLIALSRRRDGADRLRLLTFRVRKHLTRQKEQLEIATRKVIKAGIVDYDIQVSEWQPKGGVTQLEAERAEWTDGAWLDRESTSRAQENKGSDFGQGHDWDNESPLDVIIRDDFPDPEGERMQDRIEAALVD